MKVRIICWQGRYCPQYRGWFGWVGIWHKDARCFKTEKEAIEAINAKLYPEGKVLYEGEVS